MGIKEFKEKLSNIDFKTGATKVVAGICIASALCLPLSQTVHAAVPASNIVAEQTNRSWAKSQDASAINNKFIANDRYGNAIVDTDEIKKAIELSNVLNSYYFDEYYYTNTNRKEVINLNIDAIYNNYVYASSQPQYQQPCGYPQYQPQCGYPAPQYGQPTQWGQPAPEYGCVTPQYGYPQYQPQGYYVNPVENFCRENMGNKPAIDAYITFSCGTVANGIKDRIADEVTRSINDEGYRVTKAPVITVHNYKLYAVVGVSYNTRVIELKGPEVPNIINALCAVDASYNMALNNLSGKSCQFENSFAFNGVDRYTGESVWLSLPDDVKKSNLANGVETYERLSNTYVFDIQCGSVRYPSSVDYNEKQLLKNLGYTDYQARNAKAFDATLSLNDRCYNYNYR